MPGSQMYIFEIGAVFCCCVYEGCPLLARDIPDTLQRVFGTQRNGTQYSEINVLVLNTPESLKVLLLFMPQLTKDSIKCYYYL